jgi:hypothetical protein
LEGAALNEILKSLRTANIFSDGLYNVSSSAAYQQIYKACV